MRPIIGITSSRQVGGSWGTNSPGYFKVVESLEHPRKRFVREVQWHPQGTWGKDPHSKGLVSAFVAAAQHSAGRIAA